MPHELRTTEQLRALLEAAPRYAAQIFVADVAESALAARRTAEQLTTAERKTLTMAVFDIWPTNDAVVH
jgi:hypothetical protein